MPEPIEERKPAGRVSIIIPSYNYEAYVGEAIESALNQTHDEKEVIVVDDGSTDGSLEVIQSFRSQITWRRQRNQGAPVARNHGLSLASGEFVKFLDADDVLVPEAVERQVRAARSLQNKRSVVFGDRGLMQTGETQSFHPERPNVDLPLQEIGLAYLVDKGVDTACTLHRRNLLQEVGGFTEGLPCGQEYDLHLRMKLAGVQFYHQAAEVMAWHTRRNSDGISARTSAYNNPAVRIDFLRRTMSTIRRSFRGSLPERLHLPLAHRWWQTGRKALRGGHLSEAEECFEAARQLADQEAVVGSKGYKIIARVFGPVWAERVGTWLKRLIFG